MKKQAFSFLLLAVLLLGGCKKEVPPSASRIVTAVEITGQRKNILIRRHYTDERKIHYVLLYLRLLEPTAIPSENPEPLHGDTFQIVLHATDGSCRIYRQRDHRYLSVDGRPWQSIDPATASGLYFLMQKLPSDTDSSFLLFES